MPDLTRNIIVIDGTPKDITEILWVLECSKREHEPFGLRAFKDILPGASFDDEEAAWASGEARNCRVEVAGEDRIVLSFDTPWSAPLDAIMGLRLRYPCCTMTVRTWYEGDMEAYEAVYRGTEARDFAHIDPGAYWDD